MPAGPPILHRHEARVDQVQAPEKPAISARVWFQNGAAVNAPLSRSRSPAPPTRPQETTMQQPDAIRASAGVSLSWS